MGGAFTQADVDNRLVKVYPTLMTNVLATRLASIPITAQDPSANPITTSADFTVLWSYCPLVSSGVSLITTNALSTPVVIPKSAIDLSEMHGMSVWDLEWRILNLGGGRFEFYCPDTTCSGPRWVDLSLPATIKHVRRIFKITYSLGLL